MTRIQTYVFLDLETTGKDQTNRTKITEISLVAVKREHLLDTRIGCSPRVQHKLTLCVNPRKRINPGATGLCNDLLEFEPIFDKNVINVLNMFINVLTKPVCLIAYNGLKFDFPILRNHLQKFGPSFAEDVACADCFHAFYYIMEMRKTNKIKASKFVNTNDIPIDSDDDMELLNYICNMKSRNERSPSPSISLSCVTPKKPNCARLLGTGKTVWRDGGNANKMEASTYFNTNDSEMESDDDIELLKNISTCEMISRNQRSPTPLIGLSSVTPEKPNCVRIMETSKCLWQDDENANNMEASTYVNTNASEMESDDDMEVLKNISTCEMKSRNERSATPLISLSSVTPEKPNCVRIMESSKCLWQDDENANNMEASTYVNTHENEMESDDDMEVLKNISTCEMKSRNERSPTPLISLSSVTPEKPNCVRIMESSKCLWQDDENANNMEASTYVNTHENEMESDDDMEVLKNISTCEMKSRNERSPTPLISLSSVTPEKPNCVRIMESSKCLWQDDENANNMEASTYVNTHENEMESDDEMELLNNISTCEMKSRNERSPTPLISLSSVTSKKPSHIRMLEPVSFPWPEGKKPKEKYKLRYIYEQLLNRPARNPHQAENDCLFALECAVALSEEFVKWVDENNYLFSQITPMTIGAPLGK